jgi:hypothetical protein
MGLPRPRAQPGADHLEVGHDHERTDVEHARATPAEEAEQADEPERAEHIEASGHEQAPRRVEATDDDRCRDQSAPARVDPRGTADGEGTQVDQTVPGRHEGRHVAEPVDVDLEQGGEGVLHGGREQHDDRDLRAHQGCLPAQQHHQQDPGPGAERPLSPDAGTGVQQQDQRDPEHRHRHRQRSMGVRGAHPRRRTTVWRLSHCRVCRHRADYGSRPTTRRPKIDKGPCGCAAARGRWAHHPRRYGPCPCRFARR